MPSFAPTILEGNWRVLRTLSPGGYPAASGTTHYRFVGNQLMDYNPHLLDGGKWSTFELDLSLGRLTHRRVVGTGERAWLRVDRWLYALDGDQLQLCWPRIFGEYPSEISSHHGIVVLQRDHGGLPPCLVAKGFAPVDVPGRGTLVWDDNLDWWRGTLHDKAGELDVIVLASSPEALPPAIERLSAVGPLALGLRQFAAESLLETYNTVWGDEYIGAETLAARFTLSSVTVYEDGRLTIRFSDGGAFRGHDVVLTLSANDVPGDVGIEG